MCQCHGWTTSLQVWSSAWARVMGSVFHKEIKVCVSVAALGAGALVHMYWGQLSDSKNLPGKWIRVQFIFWGEKESQHWGCSWLAAILLPLKRRVHSAGSVMGRSDSVPPAIPAPCLTQTSRGYISKCKLSLCIPSTHDSFTMMANNHAICKDDPLCYDCQFMRKSYWTVVR